MRWHTVKDNFRGRLDRLTNINRHPARQFFALVTSLNSCSVLDFLDGSARYPVSTALLREMTGLIEARIRDRDITRDSGPVSDFIFATLDDMLTCLGAMSGEAHRAEPYSPPPGVVRGDPSLIQPRARPREARDITLAEVLSAMPLVRPRRDRPVLQVHVEETTDPVPDTGLTWADIIGQAATTSQTPADETSRQRAARRERGQRINAQMGLRNGVLVDVVRTEPGRFTRAMRYSVHECHATGTITLRPVGDREPGDALLEVDQTPPRQTAAPSRSDTPRRRLRL